MKRESLGPIDSIPGQHAHALTNAQHEHPEAIVLYLVNSVGARRQARRYEAQGKANAKTWVADIGIAQPMQPRIKTGGRRGFLATRFVTPAVRLAQGAKQTSRCCALADANDPKRNLGLPITGTLKH